MSQTRQLAAIMFTDIVGYTALMGRDEQKAFKILAANREIQKPIINKYGGRWIKELGDGILSSFQTVSDAVYAAIEIQQNCMETGEFSLHIGIHQGEIVMEGNDVFGDAVNIAARIQSVAPGNGILISETVHHEVANKSDIQTRFLKAQKFKNVREPIRIYEVILQHDRHASGRKGHRLFRPIFRHGSLFRSIGLFIMAFALVGALLYFTNITKGWFGNPGVETIAVLPFINESDNNEIDYLSDGMTETLISSLSQLNNVKVNTPTSLFRYKDKEINVKKIGGELNVQAILSGRIIQRGKELTLSLWLVDTRNEEDLWSKQYIRNISNLATLQSEIATDVADNLKSKLTGRDKQQLAKNYTTNEEAYQLYLRGLYFWNKRSAEDIRKSIEYFTEATQKDPLFAKAYAWTATAYLVLMGYSRNLNKEQLQDIDFKIRTALSKAQQLDSALAEVHLIAGTLYEDSWDFTAAEKKYRQVIALNPNFASAHQWYATLLTKMGRHKEAAVEMNKAFELDPFSLSINFSKGAQPYYALDFDEAIARLKIVLEMEPDHPLSHHVLGLAYEAKGMYSEAITQFRKSDVLLEKTSDSVAEQTAGLLRQALKSGGAQGYWKKQLELSHFDYKRGVGSHYKIAVNYARMEEKEKALSELENSYANRENDLTWVKVDPAFSSLYKDPRFQALLSKMRLSG